MKIGSTTLLRTLLAAWLAAALCCSGCTGEKYDGYQIEKVHLDLTSEQAVALYPANGLEAQLKWMRDFDTGQIFARPTDGATDREDSFVLLDNKVMQFNRREPYDEQRYGRIVAKLKKDYGEPETDPPHFARYNTYLRGIKDIRDQFDEILFWGDAEKSQVLSASYSKEKNEMYFLIFDPKRFNRIDQEVRENNERRQQAMDEAKRREQQVAEIPPAGTEGSGTAPETP